LHQTAFNTLLIQKLYLGYLQTLKSFYFLKLKKTWKPLGRSAVYIWLHRFGFYKKKEMKSVYIDGHKRDNIIKHRQKDFLPKITELNYFSTKYLEDKRETIKFIYCN
jgi:hypothetical protein